MYEYSNTCSIRVLHAEVQCGRRNPNQTQKIDCSIAFPGTLPSPPTPLLRSTIQYITFLLFVFYNRTHYDTALGGSTYRNRRDRTAPTGGGGGGVIKVPPDVSKASPAPKPPVDLLDFLSDDPAPPVASSTAGLTPASSTQTSSVASAQQQPWDAFGTGSGAAFTPSSVPGGHVTTPATGFTLPPAARVTNAGALPPAQQGQATEPAWATFTDGPGSGTSTATLAPVPGDRGFQANFGQSATFANSFATGGSPRLAEAGVPLATGQQQQQPQEWASTAHLPGGVQGVPPQQQRQQQQQPMEFFGGPQPGQGMENGGRECTLGRGGLSWP